MQRFAWNCVIAFCVLGGAVIARFNAGAVPLEGLWRPLAITSVVALLLASIGLLGGKQSALLTAGLAVGVAVRSSVLLVALLCVAVLIVWAERSGTPVEVDKHIRLAAPVFALAGLATLIPLVISMPRSPVAELTSTAATFFILLDGYPRADVLADVGIDTEEFIEALAVRGFDYYREAYSLHSYTDRSLALILNGVMTENTKPTTAESRALRRSWRLPHGFVAVAPAAGHASIPNTRDIGFDGITEFEVFVLQESALALLPGAEDWVTRQWRTHIEADFAALSETQWPRVFAHFMVPHVPYLFMEDGSPSPLPCWPCPFMSRVASTSPGLAGTIEWVNQRILRVIDKLLASWPEATIVLFSDHGLVFADREESHKALLAARTPGRPSMFADDPQVGRVLEVLD